MSNKKIQIIGAGTFGTALSQRFSKKFDVSLVCRNQKIIDEINLEHISSKFNNFKLNTSIKAIEKIESDADYTFICTRSIDVPSLVESNIQDFLELKNLIIACKGMEHEGIQLFSEYFNQLSIVSYFLSGPNFANEIIQGLPFASDLGGRNKDDLAKIAKDLSCDGCFLNPTTDYLTLQISGCYKNALAIYSGYIIGRGLGENYRAQICTEAIKELHEISKLFGGDGSSLYSYSGIGDIMLSCFSTGSRNFMLGVNIGLGKKIEYNNSIEGILSAKSLLKLCLKKNYRPKILSDINLCFSDSL